MAIEIVDLPSYKMVDLSIAMWLFTRGVKPNYFSDEFLWFGVLREDCPQYQPFNYLHESGSR